MKRESWQQVKLTRSIAQIPQQWESLPHQIVKFQEMDTAGYVKIVQLVTDKPAGAVIGACLGERGFQ